MSNQGKKLEMSKEEAAAAATTPPAAATAEETPAEETPAEAEAEKPECGFCVFMKAGGCSEAFEAWSRCVDSAREAEKKEEEGATKGGDDGDGAAAAAAAAAAASVPSEGGESASAAAPDFATRCRDATMALQRCMEEHRDYYKDFLADAEEAVAEKIEGAGGEEKKEEGKDE
jgi:hypothetical protein